MQITTVDEAKEALSAIAFGGPERLQLVRPLADADNSVVVEAAAALLIAEAGDVVGAKAWSAADAARTTNALRGAGPWTAVIRATFTAPDDVRRVLRSSAAKGPINFVLGSARLLRYLRDLPARTATGASRPVGDERSRLHSKVRALLAKAESTPFEAEAEACTAKAQELMARHAIDEAALGAGGAPAGATSTRVIIEAPYVRPKFVLLGAVARANRCRAVLGGGIGLATLFGSESDLWAVDLLYTSLLVQASVALQREEDRSRSFRHAFLLTFAYRIGERLRSATAATTTAASAASGSDLLPVLAAREDAAVAAMEAAFPRLGQMRVSMSNGAGASAGRRAADAASLSRDTAVAGARRQLGR